MIFDIMFQKSTACWGKPQARGLPARPPLTTGPRAGCPGASGPQERRVNHAAARFFKTLPPTLGRGKRTKNGFIGHWRGSFPALSGLHPV